MVGMTVDNRSKSTEILLATYNGEKFLAELLESLFQQTFQEFTVLVSDDGSTDATRAILETFEVNYPGRFQFLPRSPSRLGASENFGRLLNHASADYVFFCDQDDVWLPNKMETTLARMAALEARNRPNLPLLVHTDLTVVGSHLELISGSFFRYSNINPVRNDVGSLIYGNIASGCTTLVNRALYTRARPIPADAPIYDHWLAQVAALIGAIDCVFESTILYRQHGKNVIGANRDGKKDAFLNRVSRTFCGVDVLDGPKKQSQMAKLLLAHFKEQMPQNQYSRIAALAELWSFPRHRRFIKLWRHRWLRPTLLGNLSLFILVLRDGSET
jgi:glycosyltransferase involved in cell wall biosynthesis